MIDDYPATRPAPALDERWEWVEITTLTDLGPRYVRGRCNHLELIPVESVTRDVVARLCPTCDTQLPAELATV